jgi:hypothetical protein
MSGNTNSERPKRNKAIPLILKPGTVVKVKAKVFDDKKVIDMIYVANR